MDSIEIIIAKQLVKSAGIGWIPNGDDILIRTFKFLDTIETLDLATRKEKWDAKERTRYMVFTMKDYFQKVRNSRKKPRKSRKTNAIAPK
jgi:hypothetical protein